MQEDQFNEIAIDYCVSPNMKIMEKDLLELEEIFKLSYELVLIDNENIDHVEEEVKETNNNIEVADENIVEAKIIKNSSNGIKIIGGIAIGGILCGGVGAIFGIVPGIIGMSIGGGLGGGTLYFVDKIKKLIN